jgi:triosephosphate isomerase
MCILVTEITINMLQNVGCDWVLLGHPDRRNNLSESGQSISQKIILMIGELPSQRRWGQALATLRKQLGVASCAIKPDEWHKVVVAYEPVWAVGEGATPCSPEEAQRVNAALRAFINKRVSPEAAAACRLTYTGSVNEENAAQYASLEDVYSLPLRIYGWLLSIITSFQTRTSHVASFATVRLLLLE